MSIKESYTMESIAQPEAELFNQSDTTGLNLSPEPLIAVVVPHGRTGRWQWKVQHCPFCGKKHYHGAGDGRTPALLGHRTAHCLITSPASRAGYVLTLAVPADDATRGTRGKAAKQ
jgi:hypothetical protein